MKISKWLSKVFLYVYKNKYIYNESLLIIKFVLKKKYHWIMLNKNYFLNEKELEMLNFFFINRLKGFPLSYLFNKCYFFSIKYKIYYDIFIPRFDTEIMVKYAMNLLSKNNYYEVLDLGTGCGVIALSIANKFSNIKVFGVDINISALKLSIYNALKMNLNNVFFFKSNWFSNINKNFNLIISNPPYINKNITFNCNNNDLKYESYYSLYSKFNGIRDIFYIINNAYNYLYKNGWLILEHSIFNRKYILKKFKKKYINIFSYKSYINNYCFVAGQKK